MLDVLRGSEGGGGGGGGSHWLAGMDSGAGSARSSTSENAGGGRSNGRPPHHGSTRSGRHKHRLDDSLDVSGAVTSGGGEPGPDVLEVQIVPQDSWADTTAVTGNTSDVSTSVDDFRVLSAPERSLRARCRRRLLIAFAGTIAALAVLSPVVMVALPRAGALGLTPQQLQCGAECDGALIAFAFKLVILTAGGWAVFVRPARASLPRVFALRAGVLALTFIFTLSYWLFFFVRVLEERHTLQLYTLTVFAGSLVDTLLWTHYLAVLLLELRHTTPHYAVRVVRSPDGESRLYPLGTLSVQRAAAHVLERYYTDFPVYNPYLERLPTKTASRKTSSVTSYKYYDVDGSTGGSTVQTPVRLPASRRKDASHNERFYEESEYERRVKKRRSRLVTAAEEAFTHIKRLQDEHGPALPMDPHEAAQAIFPTMARPLQKYLRVTRQQPRHTMEAILAHLAQCLAHDLAPRAFLERYLTPAPVLEAERADRRGEQNWALVSETSLARSAVEGVVFQLRQHDVSLLCTVVNLPHFNLSEEIIDPKCNKFVLRLNSETSV